MEDNPIIEIEALGMQVLCWNGQQERIKNRRRIQDSECLSLRLRFAHLHPEAFTYAFRELVKRHEGLRTTFRKKENSLIQRINPYTRDIYDPEWFDISDQEAQEEMINRKIRKAIRIITNLEKGPLVYTFLAKTTADEHLFILIIHHIISDAASLDIIRVELVSLYNDLRKGLFPAGYSGACMKDIVKRQQAMKSEKEKTYWLLKLKGYDDVTEKNAPASIGFNSYSIWLSPPISSMIRETAGILSLSPFAILLTGFYLLFYARYRRLRTLFALSISDRRTTAERNFIGHLMYKIFLDETIDTNSTTRDFLKKIYVDFLRTCSHPMYYETDYDQEKIGRTVSLYLNYLPGKATTRAKDKLHQPCSPTCYHLSCFIEDFEKGLRLGWLYDMSLFFPEEVESLTRQYEEILQYICNNLDNRIIDLKMANNNGMA